MFDSWETRRLFVSYSSADSELVIPIVSLLRATDSDVFRDADNIKPGMKWQPTLYWGLRRATTVIVFWCRHAETSKWVRREYMEAVSLGKKIITLVLDTTPLPSVLREFQTLDFRKAVPEHGRRWEFWESVPILKHIVFHYRGFAAVSSPALARHTALYFLVFGTYVAAAYAAFIVKIAPQLMEIFASSSITVVVLIAYGVVLAYFLYRARNRHVSDNTKHMTHLLIVALLAA